MKTDRRFVVGVAGGSGSGKTTFARKVIEQSQAAGIPGLMFSLDNYYVPLGHLNLDERKEYNFDHPQAIDFDLAFEQLRQLRSGESIAQPVYNFKTYTREDRPRILAPTPRRSRRCGRECRIIEFAVGAFDDTNMKIVRRHCGHDEPPAHQCLPRWAQPKSSHIEECPRSEIRELRHFQSVQRESA